MAYNLRPLITILQRILDPQQTRWILDPEHTRWFLGQRKPQLESLLAKVASLEQILEKTSLTNIESLEGQIRDAAHEAEDIIESYMVDQMLLNRGVAESLIFYPPDLQQVIQKLDSAMERVVELMEERTMRPADSWCSGVSFSPDPSRKSVVVGADEDMLQLKDRLAGMQSKLQVVPIVGMGGIGKTTLARKLYQDPLILHHFDYLAWTTISQHYNIREILLSLLRCIIHKEDYAKHSQKGSDELKDILHKSLYSRKYLIVLDDIWSTNVWDEMRRFFPDNNNGSRIVITTRESRVAQYADLQSLQHQVRLLSKSDSWNLLRQIAFGEEVCPNLLQGIGEKIASDCRGLPLAIVVIGGILSKVERSEYVWEYIANNVRAAIADSGEQISNILSLSYNHLPNHLKPCFLYMGAFPEDYNIKGSRLICMWIAEGFVISNGDKSLEEEAEGYLKALVERNLLLVSDYKRNGKPKRYNIHDLLRDLCMRKANEEKFLHVVKNDPQLTFSNPRRVSVLTSSDMEDVRASAEFMPLARSCIRWHLEILSPAFVALRLLRVLDIMYMRFRFFPREIFEFVNLRYLAFSCYSEIPSGISRLWNLQILIANLGWHGVPSSEIWELSELRYLKVNGSIYFKDEDMKKVVQKKLQTSFRLYLLHPINNKNFYETMQNIKRLGIYYGDLTFSAVDLSHLHKLETLKCEFVLRRDGCRVLDTPRFPCYLKKLTLMRCAMSPVVLTALSELPNLEMLILVSCEFESDVWEAADEDVFRSLQFLRLSDVWELLQWRADETNFPRLRHLVLDRCPKLEEIPSGIGYIPTLQLIELVRCSDSAEASAKQIQEVQQSEYGNYDLKFRFL